jgi:hypothetical protein
LIARPNLTAPQALVYTQVSFIEKRKRVSRKGAKAQRRRRQEQASLNSFAFFLCVFAPLREIFFGVDVIDR